MSEDVMQKDIVHVTWRGRTFLVNGLGFWKQIAKDKRHVKHSKWEHPSSRPRGLTKAWREVCRGAV